MRHSVFGLEAKRAMMERDMKLKELAAQLGISSSYLCEIFKGTRGGEKHRKRIAEILGLEIVIVGKK
ncbi:MAG: helix-turn-helix transcriptional regulator [Cellulosilyticaceae bacterium]